MVLNKRGVRLFFALVIVAMFFGGCDPNDFKLFLITKAIAFITSVVLIKLVKYLPKEYK